MVLKYMWVLLTKVIPFSPKYSWTVCNIILAYVTDVSNVEGQLVNENNADVCDRFVTRLLIKISMRVF